MFDVVGIGNALVDTEFKVSDDVLDATALTKGNMTLADLDAQAKLFETLSSYGITPAKQAGGGSAANSMVAFASLGGQAFYNCRVGNDERGTFYLSDLATSGVSTDAQFAVHADGTTGSCAVLVSDDGERTMQTHLGTSSEICEANVKFDALKDAKWLYLEGYLAMSPSVSSAIAKLRQDAQAHGVKIAVSFADPAVVKFAKEGLDAMLSEGVDAIFCNLEEAQLYTGQDSHEDCVRALADIGKLVVVTGGADDTLIGERSADGVHITKVQATALTEPLLDTNGAGDNYAGAFLYGLSQNHDIATCGRLAANVAARIVTQFGPRLSVDAYQQVLKQTI